MNFKDFCENNRIVLKEKLEINGYKNINIKTVNVTKHNDEKLVGLAVCGIKKDVAPNIYMNGFYKDYKNGRSINLIYDDIFNICINSINKIPNINHINNVIDNIKDNVILEVSDSYLNKDRLDDLIHVDINNGLSISYSIRLSEDKRIPLTKDIMKKTNFDIKEIHNYAIKNTSKIYPPTFTHIAELMSGFQEHKDNSRPLDDSYKYIKEKNDMFVLSNNKMQRGCSVLFYPEVMNKIGEIMNEDYYVIPSSIHEVIIVGVNDSYNPYRLEEILVDTNNTRLKSSDLLSNRLFVFDRDKNMLLDSLEYEKERDEFVR